MSSNVLELTADPDIVLDPSRIAGMPDNIKSTLLGMITRTAKKRDCHWSEITWSVLPNGIVMTKRKL